MATPQECLEAFLLEKARIFADANVRLERLYSEYFGEPLLQQVGDFLLRDRQVVDEVTQVESLATIVTRAGFKTADIRRRYHLEADGQNWKIVGMDRTCFACGGTGRCGKEACARCGGEGWGDRRTAPDPP